MRPVIVFVFLLLTSSILSSAVAQQRDVATLQNSLSTAKGITRVDLLIELCDLLKFGRPSQAKDYVEEAYELSQDINYPEGIARSAFQLGIFERDERNLSKATRITESGIEAARSTGSPELELKGWETLTTIYRLNNRSQRLAEAEREYRQLKNRIELAQKSEQLSELEKDFQSTEQALSQTSAEKSAIQNILTQTTEEKLRKEAELARMAREKAELERESYRLQNETLELENEAAARALELQKARNFRNLALAGLGILLFLFLAGWQRYRLQRQRKLAAIEKQRVERLQEVDRLKDQFLANTSHELRTPLNGIIGIAEWLYEKRAEVSPKELQSNLSLLIGAGKRLNNLVQDIMDFSRLKNAELHLVLKPLNLRSIAGIVLRINEMLVHNKDLELINAIPEDLPAAHADENRVQQILHNLIGNAIKFTDKGLIRVDAQAIDGQLQISVADTGIGIPPDKQTAIFQAFQQADGSTVREFAGAGLGLSITKQLVELHGGRLWVESEPGRGSTFFFTLPATQKRPLDEDQEEVEKASALLAFQKEGESNGVKAVASANGHKVNILIVDDEPINQRVLSNHLDSGYYSITTAMNGADALEIIQSGRHFDLVLLDVMMPRMSGYEVCEQIRKKYLPSELPVIMVTAKNLVRDLVTGLDTGANDYLAKPFSRDEFLARVKTQLNLHAINQAAGRFVPTAFLRTLGRENITEVQLGDQSERLVTVFFSDLRGYTTLSENMTPDQNFKFVHALNRRMGPIISQNDGFINQYLGDAIMAIFQGGPMDALHAAIQMQRAKDKYNEERKAKGRQPIRIGMGFHTGPLIMGIIGDEQRMDAATISDTVNTASRIEDLTKHYGANILFSEDSLAMMKKVDAFHFRYLGQVQMKGKNKPVGVYECFDGDLPDMIERKIKTQDAFAQALQLYFGRQFGPAYKAFENILQINPEDLTAGMFKQKALHYIDYGVPEDWTGVERMLVK
jgi:signal transduction histidine kinase/class 3 adenylate cyclase